MTIFQLKLFLKSQLIEHLLIKELLIGYQYILVKEITNKDFSNF
jgi:hypothetical protein